MKTEGKCTCKFYEKDMAAEKEADKMEADIIAHMGKEEWEAMNEWAAQQEESIGENNRADRCGDFCKHRRSGKGHPGEYIDYCAAPGNEHVIDVEFRISEVI